MANVVGVINYGSGNYKSVCNALDFLKIPRLELSKPDHLAKVDHIILPGVGTYKNCISRLELLGLFEPLKKIVLSKEKFFLGICVGMQVLTDIGTEPVEVNGFGSIAGVTDRMDTSIGVDIPHVGWSGVEIKKDSVLFDGIESGSCFYFVHGYSVKPKNATCISSVVFHGEEIVASIEDGNIFGVQFHPEKSQKDGLKLLKNFSEL